MARGRAGWVAGVVLLLGSISVLAYLLVWLAEIGPQLELNQFLLPFLALTLIVLLLGMAGLLIRNVARLIVDRKRGLVGARLRSKLVFFFLALVLLPALVLFFGSAQLIKRTVEGMLRTPVEEITRASRGIVDAWSDHLEVHCLTNARAVTDQTAARGLLSPGTRSELGEWLELERRRGRLDWVTVRVDGRVLATAGNLEQVGAEAEPGELQSKIAELLAESSREETDASRIDYLGERLLVHAVVPIVTGPEEARSQAGSVSVGVLLRPEILQRMKTVHAASEDFLQFRQRRRNMVRFYLYLIALIFLVTLFVAVWTGFYLARRITEPIQELAAATREIAAGNLGVRVRSEVGDETGTLVDSFNEMAAELQESRQVITRSTADLRRTNKALDERRRYIETLVANLSTGVISLDPEGRVTTANPAVERILGLRLRIGDHARRRIQESGLAKLGELLDQAIAQPRNLRRDLLLPLAEGSVSVSVNISPLEGASGEDLGTLLMVEDLTDLLRAQKAAAWREMARRIAHEIKNPLTPIQLAAQRLRKKFADRSSDLDKVLPEATDTIEYEVGSLKRLVDEFSRFARMPEVKPQPVEFEKVVSSVLALYKGLHDVSLEVRTDPDLGTVMVDAEQMRRALINLVDNAVAAMDGHGTVRISARAYAGPGSLRIEVSDSGPGIPPDERDKMFVPYFSTKRRGTGLGLAIVHRVVNDHRGTIRIEDNEPRGARFVIEIPA